MQKAVKIVHIIRSRISLYLKPCLMKANIRNRESMCVVYGFLLLLAGCFFQGSFGLGMKKYQPYSWEAFWTVFSIIGILVIPVVWTWIEVPDFMSYIRELPNDVLITVPVCGLIWGISSVLFGKAVDTVGVSLTYGLNMGISASLGSLIPLFVSGDIPVARSFIVLLIGMVIMLYGVWVITKAGLDKEADLKKRLALANTPSGAAPLKEASGLTKGLLMASAAGLGSAAMNIGFSYANQVVDIAKEHGTSGTAASLIPWVITLTGGFIANAGYAIYKLIKNRTYRDYAAKGSGKALGKALLTAVIWFLALAFYAKATVLLGSLGAVVGWLAFNGLALIISNGWGLLDGEWKGFDAPRKKLLQGNVILIVSWIIVGIANSLA